MLSTPTPRAPIVKKVKLVSERLRERLAQELGVFVALPEMTYGGKWQKEAFCWVWTAQRADRLEVASMWTMTECLKAAKLTIQWNARYSAFEVWVPEK